MKIIKIILFTNLLLLSCLSANNDSIRILIKTALNTENSAVRTALLKGMLKGLEGQTNVDSPEGWALLSAELEKSEIPEHQSLARQIGQIFGDKNASTKALEILKNQDSKLVDRRDSLKSLIAQKNTELSSILPTLLEEEGLQIDAIRAYGIIPNAQPDQLFEKYKNFNSRAKETVIETLSTREDLAKNLLVAMKEKVILPREIPSYTARTLVPILGKEFTGLYGELKVQSETKAKQIEKFSALLDSPEASKADPVKGRALFSSLCGTCHQMYGEGGKIGPDLTGSNRANRDYILLNIIDPNFDVPDGYKMVVFKTNDKRVLAGTIAEEDDQKVILKLVSGNEIISKNNIKERTKLDISMMPEGMLDYLKEEDFFALIKYLQTEEQTKEP